LSWPVVPAGAGKTKDHTSDKAAWALAVMLAVKNLDIAVPRRAYDGKRAAAGKGTKKNPAPRA
jgi:hypothetical protein